MEPVQVIAYLLVRCAEKSKEIAQLEEQVQQLTTELENARNQACKCSHPQIDQSWTVNLNPQTWN